MTLNPSALWLFLIPYVMETMWLLSVFDLCGGVKGLVSTTCFCPAPAHLFILFHFCLSAFFFLPHHKKQSERDGLKPAALLCESLFSLVILTPFCCSLYTANRPPTEINASERETWIMSEIPQRKH